MLMSAMVRICSFERWNVPQRGEVELTQTLHFSVNESKSRLLHECKTLFGLLKGTRCLGSVELIFKKRP